MAAVTAASSPDCKEEFKSLVSPPLPPAVVALVFISSCWRFNGLLQQVVKLHDDENIIINNKLTTWGKIVKLKTSAHRREKN